jgi:type VI protein secretion system component VasK
VNQAVGVQNTLYPDRSGQIKVQLNLKAKVPEPETEETVSIDGTELRLAPGTGKSQTFIWSGSPAGAVFTLSGKTPGQYTGTWGVFRLFYQFNWTRTPGGFHLEWPVQGLGGQIVQYKGKNEVVEFELETPGVPLFERGQLLGLRCPAGAK